MTPKTWKNRPQKLLIIDPQLLLCTGAAGQTAQKQKTRTAKSPLMQDWVFRLGLMCLSRDNGIVISISIVQWLYEWVNICFFHIYIHTFSGTSLLIDNFFDLYNIAALMVIEPCFYLRADETFRRNWANLGPFQAIKLAFL